LQASGNIQLTNAYGTANEPPREKGEQAVTEQADTVGTQVGGPAASAGAHVREQAEALRASSASSERLNAATQKAKVQAKHVQEEAAVRGRKAARRAAKEAKKRSAQAKAQAPAVAAAAREKGVQALEVARERGGEALLAAFDTDAGKKLAHTQPGAVLKAKLTARKRRRRRLALLLLIPAAAAAAFKALNARRGGAEASDPYGDAPLAPPTTPAAAAPPAPLVTPIPVETAAAEAEAAKPEAAEGDDKPGPNAP
jgi:hypothetical protein